MIGKEIVRFHCVYWPAFLMAAGLAAAEGDRRARLAAVRREQDVEVARQHRAHRNDSRRAGRRRAAIFSAARSCVRAGWVVFFRRAGAALQLRSGERTGQSCQPHADHDHALLPAARFPIPRTARHTPRPKTRSPTLAQQDDRGIRRALRAVPVFARSGSWLGHWSRQSTSTSSKTSRGRWAKNKMRRAARGWPPFFTPAAEALRIVTALAHPVMPEATAKIWAQLGLGDIKKLRWPTCSGDNCSSAPSSANRAGISPRRQERN